MKKTILVIDDDATELDMMTHVLNDGGYRVLVAEDGAAGIRIATFAKPDLILLDICMPGIDGFETCKQLRENKRTCEIPIIFKTCLNSVDVVLDGIKSGIDDFIVKPCNHGELLKRIETKIAKTRIQNINDLLGAFQAM